MIALVRTVSRRGLAACLALCLGACSSTPKPATTDKEDTQQARKPRPSGPSIEAEVGALDENEVKKAFNAAMPAIDRCLKDAQDELPFIEGEMEVFVRVAGDGSTAWAFPRKATFGHRGTEQCVVDAISAQQWPSPQGGREGETTQYLNITTNERPAVQWEPRNLGKSGYKAMAKLRACRAKHGAASLSVTFYVDPNGKMMAAGAASGDETGRDALACAAEAPEGLRFKSPGSYPAKVTLSTP